MNHLTQHELFEYADALLPDERMAAAETHLRTCGPCSRRLASFRRVERSLRSLPLEKASADLSRNVLRSLGLQDAPSWIYSLLKSLAPLAALSAVLVVVTLVLGRGPIAGDATGAGESARGLFQLADQYGGTWIRELNAWAGSYLSFAVAKNSLGLTGFLLLFLGGIALLDRFVVMPRFRKRP